MQYEDCTKLEQMLERLRLAIKNGNYQILEFRKKIS